MWHWLWPFHRSVAKVASSESIKWCHANDFSPRVSWICLLLTSASSVRVCETPRRLSARTGCFLFSEKTLRRFTGEAKSAKRQPLDAFLFVDAQRREVTNRPPWSQSRWRLQMIASTRCRVQDPGGRFSLTVARFSFCGTGQRGQQGWAGRLATWRCYLGDQWGKHGRHAERGGPEQDKEHQDAAPAGGGEVRRLSSHTHPTDL